MLLSDALDRGRMTAESPADTDKADAALAAAGDTQAFERLVIRWQGRLLGLAWRFCRDRAMAEDMTQEAFVRAYRALPRFRSDAAFGTWLTAVALNTYRSALRDRPPVPVTLREASVPVHSDGTVARLERQEQSETVRTQVLLLPEKYRTAMVLYYFQEQDVAETARIMGVGESTLKGRLHRGRELLRKRLVALGLTFAPSRDH